MKMHVYATFGSADPDGVVPKIEFILTGVIQIVDCCVLDGLESDNKT